MKKFKGILLISDLDGTLLRGDKSISQENIKAIEYFKSNGGIFTFITGRVPAAAVPVYEIVKANAPCGCMNGGGIYDFSTKEVLWNVEISPEVYKLVDFVDENLPGVGIELCGFEKIYFYKKSSSTERHRKHENLEDISMHYSEVKEPIGKILFAEEKEEVITELIQLLEKHPLWDRFDFIRSDAQYYEILPKGVNKGVVAKRLTEILNINPKMVIGVGDNDNDESLLLAVDTGIAVSNASERAKKAANICLDVSNEEHAIAKIVDMLDKGELIV